MKPVLIYTSVTCGYCMRAKQLLQRKGVAFDEIRVDGKPDVRAEMVRKAGEKDLAIRCAPDGGRSGTRPCRTWPNPITSCNW